MVIQLSYKTTKSECLSVKIESNNVNIHNKISHAHIPSWTENTIADETNIKPKAA